MKLNIKQIGNPQNPSILFLHGFMGRGNDWDELAIELAKNHHCLLLDLPGHGDSLCHVNNFKELGDLILKHLDQKQKLSIMGYSMGGRVALYLILTFPHLFDKAIIESASPGIKNSLERKTRYLQDLELLSEVKDFRSFLNDWYGNPLFGDLTNLKEFLIEKRLKNNPQTICASLKALSVGNQPNLWQKIKSLKVPTLYISGFEDKKYTQIGAELTKLSPMISHKKIINSAHIPHIQNPQEFKSALYLFLSN